MVTPFRGPNRVDVISPYIMAETFCSRNVVFPSYLNSGQWTVSNPNDSEGGWGLLENTALKRDIPIDLPKMCHKKLEDLNCKILIFALTSVQQKV
jgi:hypothetical protein